MELDSFSLQSNLDTKKPSIGKAGVHVNWFNMFAPYTILCGSLNKKNVPDLF